MTENKITPKRRTILMKNANQNKPIQPRSQVEDLIQEYRRKNPLIYNADSTPCPTVKEKISMLSHKTAYGAFEIHEIVSDIYFQLDNAIERTEIYSEADSFCLEILPSYLSGGIEAENYISEFIIPKYPTDMKKTERRNKIKEEIRNTFKRNTKGYPRWIQSPEWPIDENNKPMIYVGQKHFSEYSEYYFIGHNTEEKRTVRQYW